MKNTYLAPIICVSALTALSGCDSALRANSRWRSMVIILPEACGRAAIVTLAMPPFSHSEIQLQRQRMGLTAHPVVAELVCSVDTVK